jgi:hypothetical protein
MATIMEQGIFKIPKAEIRFVIKSDIILASSRDVSQEYNHEACELVLFDLDTIWHQTRNSQETR